MKKYLVVAHYEGDRTLLKNLLRELAHKEPSTFHLVVPATPASSNDWTWTEEEAYQIAKQRMDAEEGDLKSVGANVTGEVLNFTSAGTVEEALKKDSYDELIVSTPPDSTPRTPFSDFEHAVRRISQIPIQQVIVPDAKPVKQV